MIINLQSVRASRAHTYYQTFFFIQSKDLGLPEMLIYPEKFFHKVGSLLGMQDIDFEEWPEFSRKFLVQGDEWGVRRLMDKDITKFFLSQKTLVLGKHWFLFGFISEKSTRDAELN